MWICVIIYFGYTQSQDCCSFEEQTPAPFYFPISNARRPLFSHILTSMCYNVLPVIPILALLVMSCSIKKKKSAMFVISHLTCCICLLLHVEPTVCVQPLTLERMSEWPQTSPCSLLPDLEGGGRRQYPLHLASILLPLSGLVTFPRSFLQWKLREGFRMSDQASGLLRSPYVVFGWLAGP